MHPINDQHFLVADEKGYTIVDRKGKVLLSPDGYQALKLADNDDLSFVILRKEGKWGVRKMGQRDWVITPEYDALEYLPV